MVLIGGGICYYFICQTMGVEGTRFNYLTASIEFHSMKKKKRFVSSDVNTVLFDGFGAQQ
jgi:hypothetical protein